MDYTQRLNISYYKTIADINKEHKVFLVQNQNDNKIYVKKTLDIYNSQVYSYLQKNKIFGIPRIAELYEEDNQLTVIEEYISGTSLSEIIASKKLSEELIIHYMCELCDILNQLHCVNPPIVHRDIKPSNIIITPLNNVMLIDFNAAKYFTDINETDTVLLGTQDYAAPEQYGFGSSTPQTDIYALGILLKELVSALPVMTDKFNNIINKSTQIDPNDRYGSVMELKAELEPLNEKQYIPKKTIKKQKLKPKDLIPPGFRTLTPWKMIVAVLVYFLIFYVGFNIEFNNTDGFKLWLNRFFCLIIMLTVVLLSFNYCDVQRFFPLCKSKDNFWHRFGIVLLDFSAVSSLFILMCIVESIFFT